MALSVNHVVLSICTLNTFNQISRNREQFFSQTLCAVTENHRFVKIIENCAFVQYIQRKIHENFAIHGITKIDVLRTLDGFVTRTFNAFSENFSQFYFSWAVRGMIEIAGHWALFWGNWVNFCFCTFNTFSEKIIVF